MSEQPFMPLWVSDFIGDTSHLSSDEVGQYTLLLLTMWLNNGRLPKDPKRLKRIARKAVSEAVMAFFDEDDNGGITQKRLQNELKKVQEKVQKARRAGEASAASKALKNNNATSTDVDPELPSSSNSSPTNHNHNHNHNHKKVEKKETRASALDVGFEDFWKSYPHKVGKAAALKAFLAALKRGASSEQIVAGVERYRRYKPPDRPWCNPATFLNQDRWLDEPARGPETVQETAARIAREREEKNGIALEWIESLDAGRSLEIRANSGECVPSLPTPGRPRGLREDAG